MSPYESYRHPHYFNRTGGCRHPGLWLHAFLALLLAALVAAFLTSGEALDTYALDEAETEFEVYSANAPRDEKAQAEYDESKIEFVDKYKAKFLKRSPMSRVANGLVPRVGKSASSSRWRRSSENACSTADLPTESCEQS